MVVGPGLASRKGFGMGVPLGSVVPNLTWTVYDPHQILVDPTTVTLTIALPDATTVAVIPGRVTTGIYSAVYVPVQAGRHVYTWTGSGSFTASYVDSFTVDGPGSAALVQVADAVAHLRGQALFSDPAELARLDSLCRAATAACESYCRRPLAVQQFTESFNGRGLRGNALYLARRPIVDVLAVSENSLGLTVNDDYMIDQDSGALYRGGPTYAGGSGPQCWASGFRNISVTYTAGYLNPPADMRLAVLREVEHLWQRTQNAPHPGTGADGYDEMMRDAASAMPWPVRYLLDPYQISGFA